MQNAKYICNFLNKNSISFERGDIDVRTSHAKPSCFLFFIILNVSRFGPTLFYQK